jgi:hypothetical protein
LCNFLHSPFASLLLGPNILLSILFSNTLSQCSFLNVRDQVSYPYKTTGRLMVLYVLTIMFLDSRQEDSDPNGSRHSLKLVFSLSLCACNFDLLVLFPNIWILSCLQRTCSLSLCYAFVLLIMWH